MPQELEAHKMNYDDWKTTPPDDEPDAEPEEDYDAEVEWEKELETEFQINWDEIPNKEKD